MLFFSNPRLRGTAWVEMATYFAFGAFETFLPVFLFSRGGDAYHIGIIFAVQVLVIAATKPFFGMMADRIDKRIQIGTGLIITGCAVTVIPLISSFEMFLVVSSLFGKSYPPGAPPRLAIVPYRRKLPQVAPRAEGNTCRSGGGLFIFQWRSTKKKRGVTV